MAREGSSNRTVRQRSQAAVWLQVDIMVTAGANQAFVNVLLTLTDATDSVVLFRPYYFNHLMACQMTGGARSVVFGPPDVNLKPDLQWLEAALQGEQPPKMVVIVNPCNPAGVRPSRRRAQCHKLFLSTRSVCLLDCAFDCACRLHLRRRSSHTRAGFLLTEAEVRRAQALTAAAGAWLVLDNTYEHFVYDSAAAHFTLAAANVVNIFSFSKAFGMMGWRVGYLALPNDDSVCGLGAQMLKVQDTIPICATQVSQGMALAALRGGRDWVTQRVADLVGVPCRPCLFTTAVIKRHIA